MVDRSQLPAQAKADIKAKIATAKTTKATMETDINALVTEALLHGDYSLAVQALQQGIGSLEQFEMFVDSVDAELS